MLQLSHKTISTLKSTFHGLFVSVILLQLIRVAFYTIPNDWLFFFTSDAIENLVCAFIAYALYYVVFELFGVWKKVSFVLIFSIGLLFVALLKDYRIHSSIDVEQTFEYFTSFLGQALLFYSFIYFINRLEFLNKYKELEKELSQAKEQLLRNQLHPHFLFNAFNSLYSLSLSKHPDTSNYILKLSSMMRYVTDDTHLESVPIQKELNFIEEYIAIEKIRFGKDARISLIMDPSISKPIMIAPFLLITLVENAFKHGFYTNSKKAFVTIVVKMVENELVFIVKNSRFKAQHFQDSGRKGTGLQNLKQRLQLLFPKNSKLIITSTKETYTAQLNITLH